MTESYQDCPTDMSCLYFSPPLLAVKAVNEMMNNRRRWTKSIYQRQ